MDFFDEIVDRVIGAVVHKDLDSGVKGVKFSANHLASSMKTRLRVFNHGCVHYSIFTLFPYWPANGAWRRSPRLTRHRSAKLVLGLSHENKLKTL